MPLYQPGSITAVCELMHSAMLKDLHVQSSLQLSPMQEVSACFERSRSYWSIVEWYVTKKGFADKAEEMTFFRAWKPQFASCIEYYSLRYHSILFQPSDMFDRMHFWKREMNRMEDRLYEFRTILKYYHSDRTDMDELYF